MARNTRNKEFQITAKCYNKRGRLISVGTNSYRKTHPVQQHFASQVGLPEKIYMHAEIAALLKAGQKKVHKIVVERFDVNGNPALAEPCPICKAAIKAWGVAYVEHTT